MPRPDRQTALFTPAPLPVARLDAAERLACLRLIRSENVGPVAFRELINHCGGARGALAALPELARRGGGRAIRVCPAARAEAELEAAERAGAEPVFTIEPHYPKALAIIGEPPPMLYLKGGQSLLDRPAIAIVGSRLASAAGTKLARSFAAELAEAGFLTVSGLARGIDAAVHEASLAAGTAAVLAGGIDVVYPPEHARLQAAIGERGCLVSEMPPGFVPRAREFPRRNRIISGISLGVLVIEAARRSGTLVTARYAGEQGREVFAVPGHPLDPRAEGTNQLLKTGATLVTEPRDVIEALAPQAGLRPAVLREIAAAPPFPHPAAASIASDISTAERDRVLGVLSPQPADVDEIVRTTGLSVREVGIVIMELELAGRLERHGGQLVSLRPGGNE